jgi:hypothetical protein
LVAQDARPQGLPDVVASARRRKVALREARMHVVLQIIFVILWTVGLMVLVIGIYYGVSLLVLAAVSRLLPLTGRRPRLRSRERSPTDSQP